MYVHAYISACHPCPRANFSCKGTSKVQSSGASCLLGKIISGLGGRRRCGVRGITWKAAGLLLAPLVGLASVAAADLGGKPTKDEGGCGKHGTSVAFVG